MLKNILNPFFYELKIVKEMQLTSVQYTVLLKNYSCNVPFLLCCHWEHGEFGKVLGILLFDFYPETSSIHQEKKEIKKI